MACASNSIDATEEAFQLFRSVIPQFASVAGQRVTKYRDNAELRIPYVLFEADLILLSLRGTTIAERASTDSMAETRNACMDQVTQMLEMLEIMLWRKQTSTESHKAYPLLEGIRSGTVSCSTFELYCHEGDQYTTVSRFSQCAREVDRLCSDQTQLLPPRRRKKQLSFERTRALARLLHECVSAQLQCQCNSCQGSMLYLQTHCRPEPSRPHLDFKLLFTKYSAASYKWFEGVVNVALPKACDTLTISYTLTTRPQNGSHVGSAFISSICLALPPSNMSILNIGIQEDGKISKRPPPRERASASTYREALTLEEILLMTPPLPLKLRRVLAVVLAHSALQLYATRWLPGALTSKRVIFMQTDQGHVVPRPLIAARGTGPENGEEEESVEQDLAHSNPFVLSLGIILLELWSGKHISELRGPADIPPDGVEDPNTDLFTAQRLWEQSEWDMNTRYRSAVGACLNWDMWELDKASPERLCRMLYEKVVSPIEDQLAEEFNANIEEVDNLLLALSRNKDRRGMVLTHQQGLSSRGKRLHADVSNHNIPVKRRQTTANCKSAQRWSPLSESSDDLATHLDPKTFTVAVVCALGGESNAVISVMDEIYETLPDAARKDSNAYTTGRIGTTPIVVVHLPGMGKLNAANSAVRLKSTFPNVHLCIVVGVCGGVPYNARTKKDIFLGDIIISTGLKQIDFGRFYANGIVPKDDPEDNFGRPDERLRSFLRMLSEIDHYHRRVADATSIALKTRGLVYPGANRDHLYEPTYQHQCHRADLNCGTCDPTNGSICQYALEASCRELGCESARIMTRARLSEPHPAKPAVHFGRVACSDWVMKSAQDRDRFAQKYNVIGFEMEAAGAWDIFPTIVIKGVCDYADSHKNKLWQGYSAAIAASCMKAVLAEWSSRTTSAT